MANSLMAENSVTAGAGGGSGNSLYGSRGPGGTGRTSGPDVSGNAASSDHDLIGNSSGFNATTSNGDILNPPRRRSSRRIRPEEVPMKVDSREFQCQLDGVRFQDRPSGIQAFFSFVGDFDPHVSLHMNKRKDVHFEEFFFDTAAAMTSPPNRSACACASFRIVSFVRTKRSHAIVIASRRCGLTARRRTPRQSSRRISMDIIPCSPGRWRAVNPCKRVSQLLAIGRNCTRAPRTSARGTGRCSPRAAETPSKSQTTVTNSRPPRSVVLRRARMER
jgi:hypothetical protein